MRYSKKFLDMVENFAMIGLSEQEIKIVFGLMPFPVVSDNPDLLEALRQELSEQCIAFHLARYEKMLNGNMPLIMDYLLRAGWGKDCNGFFG